MRPFAAPAVVPSVPGTQPYPGDTHICLVGQVAIVTMHVLVAVLLQCVRLQKHVVYCREIGAVQVLLRSERDDCVVCRESVPRE